MELNFVYIGGWGCFIQNIITKKSLLFIVHALKGTHKSDFSQKPLVFEVMKKQISSYKKTYWDSKEAEIVCIIWKYYKLHSQNDMKNFEFLSKLITDWLNINHNWVRKNEKGVYGTYTLFVCLVQIILPISFHRVKI